MMMGAFLGLFVASCADQNFDWEDAKSQNPEYTFRTNFEKLVGKIDPNQTWDFSTMYTETKTRAVGDNVTTVVCNVVGSGNNETLNGVTLVTETKTPAGLLSALSNNYKDNEDHTSISYEYTMTAKGNFVICPVWHGGIEGGEKFSLIVTGYNKTTDQTVIYEFPWEALTLASGLGNKFDHANFMTTSNGNAAPKGIVLPFDDGMEITFSLKTATGKVYDQSRIIWDNTTVQNPYYGKRDLGNTTYDEIMVFDTGTDKDFNDLVVLLYSSKTGLQTPEIVPNTRPEKEIQKAKRYMVEDLGSTSASDIDFNDIVIDLFQTIEGTSVEQPDGSWVYDENSSVTKQYAIVRAAGGTMDFEFLVDGEVIFRKSAAVDYRSMINTYKSDIEANGYDVQIGEKFEITGWDPTANNVSFRVAKTSIIDMLEDGGMIYDEWKKETETFSFPAPGETPYIMAFNITKEWRDERHPICSHFLEDLEGTEECEECGGKSDYKQ